MNGPAAIGDAVLVLAWLVLAHLAADFVFQTAAIVRAKNGRGRAALGGLVAHGAIVAACLVPVGLAYAGPGWLFVAWSALLHVAIDRAKILLSRRAAAAALADAHRRHEAASQPADHLGRAWTASPAGLFVADQLAHLAVLAVGWAAFLSSSTELQSGWTRAVDALVGGLEPGGVHRAIGVGVVLAALAIVNIRAASIFVAILVRPVEEVEDEVRWGGRAAAAMIADPEPAGSEVPPATSTRRWAIRLGPFAARVEAEPGAPVPEARVPKAPVPESPVRDAPVPEAPLPAGSRPTAARSHAALPQAARVGATIGVLERILIVVFVLTGSEAAIGFVVAAKTLARFRLLDDRDFAEYYLLGTLGSVATAIITGLVGRAALGVLLA